MKEQVGKGSLQTNTLWAYIFPAMTCRSVLSQELFLQAIQQQCMERHTRDKYIQSYCSFRVDLVPRQSKVDIEYDHPASMSFDLWPVSPLFGALTVRMT